MIRHTTPRRSVAARALPSDEPPQRRSRLRRGGPRTPLPLLPLIAVAAGVGIAYVNQTAHATSASYHETELTAHQDQLRAQDRQLRDELARLESSERIVAAAQRFGMRPSNQWAYVASLPVEVIPPIGAQETGDTTNTAVQRLLAELGGDFGPSTGR